MSTVKSILKVVLVIFCFSYVIVHAQVTWDFEDGKDHGFTLWCVNPATPAADNPNTAGDEAITGVGGADGLPGAGNAWSIGPPNQYDGLAPAIAEGCHDDIGGILGYSNCNDPFTYALFEPNPNGQIGYLNTYNLNQWGDNLHSQSNDQIATSPPVQLSAGAKLYVWSFGGGNLTIAPAPETDRKDGYLDPSSGIAVLSAQDSSFLTSVLTIGHSVFTKDSIDLSGYAGQTVIIEVVDAFQGSWGWLAVDQIQITNATLVPSDVASKPSAKPTAYAIMQNYPNPFNPQTTITYQLPEKAQVSLKVFDITGHEVATLVKGEQAQGNYSVKFDGNNMPSGIYFYQLQTNEQILNKRMLLLK